jgi:thiol-disulfide isomerase/thioredoxin
LSSDFAQIKRSITLKADTPDVDLSTIDLAASKLAKLKGKAAPTLSPTDARGVKKSVQITDYRGKWVALEFWGYWCGPCVGRALPQMMEIYDDHESERDRFVILTVHSPETTTFAELDEKVKPVVRDVWAGRMIPFPILLDGDEKLQDTFGVRHWPTTLLFDPDGKFIGEVKPDALECRLQGKIDPEAQITASGKVVPMREALEVLVAPLGLHVVLRDEVIVLEAK